jgi:putative flippase GtrA
VTAVAQQLKRWLADPVDSLAVQVPRALVASVLAAIIDCSVLFFLADIAGWERIPAAVIGYLAGSVVQFILCAHWVFAGAPHNAAGGFVAFLVLSLFGLAITWLTIALLGGVHLALAKTVALGLAFNWNFLSRKYLLFRLEAQEHPPVPRVGILFVGRSIVHPRALRNQNRFHCVVSLRNIARK